MTVVRNERHGLYLRDDTNDKQILGEQSSYRELGIRKDDVVMDVGAHIGIFTVFAARTGAELVVSYEPEEHNLDLFRLNTEGLENVELVPCALVGRDVLDTETTFYVSNTKDQSNHTLISKRGRNTVTVQCRRFIDELARVDPTVLKVDVEGAEYDLLDNEVVFSDRLRAVTAEFHFGKREHQERALALWKKLDQQFEVRRAPRIKAWGTVGVWVRD